MKFIKKFVLALMIALCMSTVFGFDAAKCSASESQTNIIFEESFEGDTSSWYTYSYNGSSEFVTDTSVAYDGNSSFMIENKSKNDARIINKISVEPLSYYTVTAYVKTEGVKESSWFVGRLGATISVLKTTFVSESIEGDTPWTELKFSFATGKDRNSVELCFTLGGYGMMNSGKAWFDNITVEKVSSMPKDAFALDDSVITEQGNILENGDFESDDISAWYTYSYVDDVSYFTVDNTVSRNGKKSLCIESTADNDARIIQNITVSPNKYYTVTAWVKTQSVPYSSSEKPCYGATISVMDTTYVSDSLHGTGGWNKLTFSFYTAEKQTSVELCLTLGGYGMMNSGKVWFDDITVEEVAKRPEHLYHLEYTSSDNVPISGEHWAGYPLQDNPDAIKWTAFAFMWFIVIAALALVYAETDGIKGNDKSLGKAFCFIMVTALISRIIMGMFVPAYSYDYSCWYSWSWSAATDLFNLYNGDNFIDYPPLYMYLLAPLGIPVRLLWNIMGGTLSALLLKLPSIIADMLSAYVLYKIANRYLNKKWAVFIAAFYLFNPAIWINSACWGQIDSLFTLLVLLVMYFITEKNWVGTGIMFALTVLLKPHGIIFTPAVGLALLFEVIKKKDIKPMLVAVGAGVAAGIVVVLPFYIKTGFENPTWLIKLYATTVGKQYNYATMNGFNFYAMLGKNNVNADNTMLGLTFSQWGTMGVGLAILLSIVFMVAATRKKMNPSIQKAAPLIVALVVYVTVFTFAHKMHERYMFAAIALALFIFIITKERSFMYLAMLFSVVIFVNTYYIYNLNIMYIYCHPEFGDKWVMLFGGVEVASFVMMMFAVIKVAVKNVISPPKSLKDKGEEKNLNKLNKLSKSNKNEMTERRQQKRQKALEKACDKSYYKMKLGKKDWLVMLAMTILYTCIAFIYLGTTLTPQTYWTTSKRGEYFIVDLGEEVHVSRINFYCGIKYSGKIRIMYYDENSGMYKSMYKWETVDGKQTPKEIADINLDWPQFKVITMDQDYDPNLKTRYLKFITLKSGLEMGEIGIFADDSRTPLKVTVIESTVDESAGSVEALFDEPESIPYSRDAYNSTYFDEIYHGATAYEHLMKIRPSEWTHPPLGKLLIAGGMLIFGKSMFGMRAMGTIFGILLIPLMYLFGKKITKDSWGGVAAAFLMMFDFMHFTHSRISSIDVYGVTFVLLMFYFMYDFYVSRPQNLGLKKSFAMLLASGFFMGCAISVKWNMAYGAVGLAIIFAIAVFEQIWHRKLIKDNGLEEQNPWTKNFITDNIVKTGIFCVFAFIVLPITLYFATFIPYTQVTDGDAYTFKDIISLQGSIYEYHSKSVVGSTHSFQSAWYTWPVIGRPLWMYDNSANSADGIRGTIVTMGNPAIWWVGIACVFLSIIIALKKNDRRMLPVFIAIVSLYLPWMLVERCTFIYHYFPILPFVMLCIAYVIVYVKNNLPHGKIAIGVYFAIVAGLFVMFFPVLTGIRVDVGWINFLKWFPSWYF